MSSNTGNLIATDDVIIVKSSEFGAQNYGHNIMILFNVLPKFPFTTSKTKRDYQ